MLISSSPPTMASISVDKLVNKLENPTIPLIYVKSTYVTIHAKQDIIKLNTASVNTNLICGTLGHLCLTLSPTVYATLLTIRFIPPPNPGATLVIPAGITGPEAASIGYAHFLATLDFNTFWNVDRALCQQLMGTIK